MSSRTLLPYQQIIFQSQRLQMIPSSCLLTGSDGTNSHLEQKRTWAKIKFPDDSSIDLKFILGSITEIAEALITGHWEFSTLIMVQPRSTHIPLHVFLKELIKIPIFKAQVACHGSHLLSCVYVVSI